MSVQQLLDKMNSDAIVKIVMAIALTVIGIWGIWQRIKGNGGKGYGIGIRFIQFLAVGMGIPAFILLVIAGKITEQQIGWVIAAAMGLIAAKAGKDEEK